METILHKYKFDISNPNERILYQKLYEELSDGRNWMHCLAGYAFGNNEKVPEGKVELETEFLFSNQWNTKCGFRVFDWYEGIYHNSCYKVGHYLDITEEMKEIRRNTNVCGYCGYQEYSETGNASDLCTSCLSSPYLKKEDLFLLRMLPVELHFPNRNKLTKKELDYLLPLYTDAQTKKKIRDQQAMRSEIKREREKKVTLAHTEAEGMLWLLDHDVNIENVIFYNHTNTFCFGWRSGLSADIKGELEKLLKDFPFKWEIKV